MSNFPKVLCSVAPIARVLSMALSGSSGCQLFFNTARNFSKYHSGAALVKAAQVPVEFDMQTLNMKLRRALDLHANVVHDYAIRNNRKRVTAVHMSLRFYSNSGPGSDPKEKTTEESQEAHKTVVEYAENLRQSHYRNIEKILLKLRFEYGAKPDVEAILKRLAISMDDNAILRDEIKSAKNNLNQYGFLRWLTFVRKEIDQWETNYGIVEFEMDYKMVKKFATNHDKSKEIRRQRWVYILNNENNYGTVDDLLKDIAKNNISINDFALKIADGYDLVSNRIKTVIMIPGSKPYISTENTKVNTCVELLLKDTEFRVGHIKE